MPLEAELATYRRELPNLLKEHEGQYVLIKGEQVAGFWGNQREAIDAGRHLFGLVPILVRQVRKEEPALGIVSHPTGGHLLTHLVTRCRTSRSS